MSPTGEFAAKRQTPDGRRSLTPAACGSQGSSRLLLFQRRDEEAVNVVAVGPGARGAVGEQERGGCGGGLDLFEIRVGLEEGGDDLFILLPLDRAGGVDEAPAAAQDAGGLRENSSLHRGQLAEAFEREAPAYLGVVAQRARARTGRIHEHAVERL